jgi:hypothetical protein
MLFFVMLALMFIGVMLMIGLDELNKRMKELIEALKESTMVKELPKTVIEGKEYYVDERLQEYRRCDNPHDRIPFGQEYMINESVLDVHEPVEYTEEEMQIIQGDIRAIPILLSYYQNEMARAFDTGKENDEHADRCEKRHNELREIFYRHRKRED